MKTFWVCVAHRWLVPPIPCGARGNSDSKAARHTEHAPHHPTFTTTSELMADAIAGSQTKDCPR